MCFRVGGNSKQGVPGEIDDMAPSVLLALMSIYCIYTNHM